jgi:hypothetical protein
VATHLSAADRLAAERRWASWLKIELNNAIRRSRHYDLHEDADRLHAAIRQMPDDTLAARRPRFLESACEIDRELRRRCKLPYSCNRNRLIKTISILWFTIALRSTARVANAFNSQGGFLITRSLVMSHKDLTELQATLRLVEKRFGAFRDKSDEAAEIAAALDALQSMVAVHRIRAEISRSKHPFELRAKRESGT